MEILLLIWSLVVTTALVMMYWRLHDLEKALEALRKRSDSSQSRIHKHVSSTATPHIDSRARTTRRDTDDIPARGGRMTKTTRRGYDSVSNDDRLPDGA